MLSAARNILAPPLGGEGHEVARGCAAASEVSDSLVGKYQSDGQTSDVRQTVFPKVRGHLYIMKGAIMIKPYNRPAGEEKQANRPAGVEMHPFCRLRRRLPRRGRFALRSAFVLISISRHSAAKTSPSGGGAVGRRGAFPTRRRRGCMVFAACGSAAAERRQ